MSRRSLTLAIALTFASALPSPAQSPTGVPRTYAPTRARSSAALYPWRRNITASVFWIGEKATAANPTHNKASSWDPKWMTSYGGFDDPDPAKRTFDCCPKAFTPKLNPFYIALPYNDRINWAKTKPGARRVVPWYSRTFEREGKSVCNGRWLAIHHRGKTCFAQWCDVGPFETDDSMYVFGNARPKNASNKGAGIDLSPAVRDYLKIKGGLAAVDWRFVELREIPYGPWRKYGDNNHFIHMARHLDRAKREEIERLKKARDQWLKSGGK
jgi:hypothetical protein